MNWMKCGVPIASAVAMLAMPADAVTSLRLTDSAGSITIADNQAGDDGDNATGVINYNSNSAATTLSSWDFVAAEGGRCQIAGCPTMTLSLEGGNQTADSLTVEISSTDFSLPDGVSWLGDHLPSATIPENTTISMSAYWSGSNALFQQDQQIGETFTVVGEDSDGEVTSSLFPEAVTQSPFSMTLVFDLETEGGQNFTAQSESVANLSAIPLPAGLPMFLAGLAGLGFAGWRRRSDAAA